MSDGPRLVIASGVDLALPPLPPLGLMAEPDVLDSLDVRCVCQLSLSADWRMSVRNGTNNRDLSPVGASTVEVMETLSLRDRAEGAAPDGRVARLSLGMRFAQRSLST